MGTTNIKWPMPPCAKTLAAWALEQGIRDNLEWDEDGTGARYYFEPLMDAELNKKDADTYAHLLSQGIATELKIFADAFMMFRMRNFTNVAFTFPQHHVMYGSNKNMVQLALYEGV